MLLLGKKKANASLERLEERTSSRQGIASACGNYEPSLCFLRRKFGVNRDRGSHDTSRKFPSFHRGNEQPLLLEGKRKHVLFSLVK